jgi:hypothetical protein
MKLSVSEEIIPNLYLLLNKIEEEETILRSLSEGDILIPNFVKHIKRILLTNHLINLDATEIKKA